MNQMNGWSLILSQILDETCNESFVMSAVGLAKLTSHSEVNGGGQWWQVPRKHLLTHGCWRKNIETFSLDEFTVQASEGLDHEE